MARFQVVHRTEYRYAQTMTDGFTTTHLLPRATLSQTVESATITVDPQPDELDHTVDQFGNSVMQFAVHRPHDRLSIESLIWVSVADPSVADPSGDGTITAGAALVTWEEVRAAAAAATDDLALELGPFLAHSGLTPRLGELAALVDPVFGSNRGMVEAVAELGHRIFGEFRFDPGFTDVATPLGDVLAARRGVCQDFAHVAAAALRSTGLPARYVSGYIETLPAPGQPKLVGADASHAWCSVWAGPLGWLDFDPTNDQMPPQCHVTVGWGRDYLDVAPVRGVVIGPGGEQTLTVSVDVMELNP